jgi:TRAP-type C4-dicarboxylate transport system substrate-binding protein
VDDFKNLTANARPSPVFTEMWKALGARMIDSGDTNTESNITQTTLPRYHVETTKSQKHVTNTQHSMYLTTILMNDDMWNDLSVSGQMHFKEAAKICARAERAKSVQDAEDIKNDVSKQQERGIDSIKNLSPEETKKLRDKLDQVTNKFAKFFSNNLVDRIRKA